MTEFKETDLYEPIRAFLEEEGYQVQAEVKHCDIAAEKDGRLVVVELKRAFGLKLVYQGLERQSLTDEVFAAATAKLVRNNRRWSENWMIGIAFSSWSSWVFGTVIGAFSGSGLLQGYPAVEAALGFMLPALFMSFLLASFQRKQSLCVTAALVGALAGVTLFSIPVAILAGIVCGCLTALIQAFWQGAPDEL